MSKITKATFKSFIKKNQGKIYIKRKSSFDGMVDGVVYNEKSSFVKTVPAEYSCENNLGIQGVWLVGGRDRFYAFEESGFKGIEVYNCCGSFVLAVNA